MVAVKRRPQPPLPGKGGGHMLFLCGSDSEPFSTLDQPISCVSSSCTACMHARTFSLPPSYTRRRTQTLHAPTPPASCSFIILLGAHTP